MERGERTRLETEGGVEGRKRKVCYCPTLGKLLSFTPPARHDYRAKTER